MSPGMRAQADREMADLKERVGHLVNAYRAWASQWFVVPRAAVEPVFRPGRWGR